MGFRWTRPPSVAWDTRGYVNALETAIGELLLYWAAQIEGDAKRNATWTDRTANARQTLAAFVFSPSPGKQALVLRQTVTYGKWLELRHGGRYAIVMRTLENTYAPLWSSVRGLVE